MNIILSNDAGASEYLAYMLLAEYDKSSIQILCMVNSPASKIFKKLNLNFDTILSLDNIENKIINNKVDTIIYGTGWQIDFSKWAKDISNKYYIKTIAIIDHWTGYKERFAENSLPDEIIVMDDMAYNIAKKTFNNTVNIIQKKNYFLENIKDKFMEIRNKDLNKIVFISEPTEIIAKKNTGSTFGFGFTEYSIVEELMQNFDNIIIRLHPSDDEAKYDTIISKYPNKEVQIIKPYEEKLTITLSKSKLTIGFDGMALYISYILGINTISYMPNSNRKVTIPIPKKYQLKDLKCIL